MYGCLVESSLQHHCVTVSQFVYGTLNVSVENLGYTLPPDDKEKILFLLTQ